ncbi:MAG TPA: 2OG-Fe(II) oxygenase [Terriglobales bacterium]|nr:2OG-Fe(II) oxygenase [Terriglobales bacterium]
MSTRAPLTDFPNDLINDERLFSEREREIVSALLRHANHDAGSSAETRSAMLQAIERAVGETVAQRAYGLLGHSIVDRLIHDAGATGTSSLSALTVPDVRDAGFGGARAVSPGTRPPSPQPEPPGFEEPEVRVAIAHRRPPSPQPEPPGFEEPDVRVAIAHRRPPNPEPDPPSFDERSVRVSPVTHPPKEPDPPGFGELESDPARTSVAVLEAARPAFRAAQYLVLDEFLVPAEVEALMGYALAKESEFKFSEVVTPGQKGEVDFDHRRSRVLVDIGEHEGVIVDRIKASLARILDKLNLDPFEISRVEAQMTASGDGDFFHQHTDDGSDKVKTRQLTFVYFFHREPVAFSGGELRIYDSVWKDGYYQAGENYRSIQPAQNQIVFFPSCLVHEITPIEIPSRAFADSRFTVNGWFRR